MPCTARCDSRKPAEIKHLYPSFCLIGAEFTCCYIYTHVQVQSILLKSGMAFFGLSYAINKGKEVIS